MTTPTSSSTTSATSSSPETKGKAIPKLFLPLLQAPSKEDKLELHQALTTIFKTLLV